MARDPGSVWAPLPEAGAPDGYRKDKFIVHSTGSNGTAQGTRNYFALAGVVNESTFIVGTGPDDPTLQLMDSTDNADANVAANQTGISVEVVGDGRGGYSAWQRGEIIRLGRWAVANHPIARQIVPLPSGSGFGWHIMFGAPGPWTTVNKICPGPVRIQQLKTDIFPAIFAGDQEDDMPSAAEVAAAVLAAKVSESTGSLAQTVKDAREIARRTELAVLALAAHRPDVDEAALAKALAPLIEPSVIEAIGEAKGITQADVEAAVSRVLARAAQG